ARLPGPAGLPPGKVSTVARPLVLGRHLAAGLGAAAAGLDAILHLADPFAIRGIGLANLRANPAGQPVARRTTEHEVRGRVADLHAVGHEPQVLRLDVLPAQTEAVLVNH